MKLSELDIIAALRSKVNASYLKKVIPSLTQKRLDEFYDELASGYSKIDGARLYIDGASDKNGNGGIGVILFNDHQAVDNISRSIGKSTNNEAEYQALLEGVSLALKHHFKTISVYSDSELLVKQINGQYKVKAQNLKSLHDQAQLSLSKFDDYSVTWVPREKNSIADGLAKTGSGLNS